MNFYQLADTLSLEDFRELRFKINRKIHPLSLFTNNIDKYLERVFL